MNLPDQNKCSIAIIGLGYVGLPLALTFSERKKCSKTKNNLNRKIIGFDINQNRVKELISGFDSTNEIEFNNIPLINFTDKFEDLICCDVFIVTVPTPINNSNNPDLKAIKSACSTVGKVLKLRNDYFVNHNKVVSNPIIIYESTVYPGCTEEICVPIIKKESELIPNKDFFYGYSPERINPGDKKHKLKDIKKVTSGSNYESAKWIDNLYCSIIDAGTHLCKSIKIAEAAKVIENTQRDLNIALINELSIICNLLDIDTLEVLQAAETKWNFHSYRPGLVGGHCIGVDPYYLTYKAQELGYLPEVVLAGRRINNSMGERIVKIFVKEFFARGKDIKNSNVLILGLTFKENCSDIRNTKVLDIIKKLKEFKANLIVVDPLGDISKAQDVYDLKLNNSIPESIKFDGIIVAVSHNKFRNFNLNYWQKLMNKNCILFDIKGIVPDELEPLRL